MVELPVEWILDDAPLYDPRGANYASPREVAQVWMDEFDKAWEEGTVFLLTMHPHISGHRSRVVALELLIKHMKENHFMFIVSQVLKCSENFFFCSTFQHITENDNHGTLVNAIRNLMK